MFKNLIHFTLTMFIVAAAIASPFQARQDDSNPLPPDSPSTIDSLPPPDSPPNSFPPPNTLTINTLTPAQIKALQQELILAPSVGDRQAILFPNPPDASNITFQFINATHSGPTGGEIVLSGVDTFPALIGTNVAAAIGFMDGCSLNVPHSHPRANEFLTVISGTLIGGLMLESNPGAAGDVNGTNPTAPVPMVSATLSSFVGMLFPQGQVHFQFNPTCQPAVFTAAFDSSDAGRIQIANTFFSIQPDAVLTTSLGGNLETLSAAQIDTLRGNIPDAFAELMDDCAKTCGIPTS